MKKWSFVILLILLSLSILLNGIYLSKNRQMVTILLDRYQQEIVYAEESLRTSLIKDDPNARQLGLTSSSIAISKARVLSEVLGQYSSKHSFEFGSQAYFNIAYEMYWFLENSSLPKTSEEDLQAVSKIFSIYAKHLKSDAIRSPQRAEEILRTIHREIKEEDLIPSTIPVPFLQ